MAVSKKRQSEMKGLGFLLQNDKEHYAVRILGRAGNFTTEELKNINYLIMIIISQNIIIN